MARFLQVILYNIRQITPVKSRVNPIMDSNVIVIHLMYVYRYVCTYVANFMLNVRVMRWNQLPG
jgi:hypothetical protein